MYDNPKNLLDHSLRVWVDEKTYRLVCALAEYNGQQRGALVRELLLEGLESLRREQANKNSASA